jgi:hypothetical protein
MPISDFRRYYGPVARIRQQGLRKGVLGGDRAWLITWVLVVGTAALKRRVTRQQRFVSVDLLRPGEEVAIRTVPVSSAKERKRLLRGQN